MFGLSLTRSLRLLRKRDTELEGRIAELEKALALDGSLLEKKEALELMARSQASQEETLIARADSLGILKKEYDLIEVARRLARDAQSDHQKRKKSLDAVERDLEGANEQLRGLRDDTKDQATQLRDLEIARAAYDKTEKQYDELCSDQEKQRGVLESTIEDIASEQKAEREALKKLQESRAKYDQQWGDTERIIGTMQDVKALHEGERSLTEQVADATEALNSLRQQIKDTKRKRSAESALAILETDLRSGFVSEWAPDLVKCLTRHDEARTKKWLLEYLVRKPEGHSISLVVDANSLIVDGDPIEQIFATYWRENSGQPVEMDALVSCWERLAESGGA